MRCPTVALDLLSGGILFLTALLAQKPNPMQYPLGKAKMEPLGIVVFSALMGMSALMVAVESIKALASSQCEDEAGDSAVAASPDASLSNAVEDRCLPESYTIDIALTTAFILVGVVLVKAVLLCYCRSVQKMRGSASVQAYADDHFNDALSNGVSVAVFCLAQFYCPDGRLDMSDGSSVCPAVILWWLDPLAALLLSLLIFANWVDSGREQLLLLVGHIAPTLLLQQLTYAPRAHGWAIVILLLILVVSPPSLLCSCGVSFPDRSLMARRWCYDHNDDNDNTGTLQPAMSRSMFY